MDDCGVNNDVFFVFDGLSLPLVYPNLTPEEMGYKGLGNMICPPEHAGDNCPAGSTPSDEEQ